MPEFLKVKTPEEIINIIRGFEPLEAETVPLGAACGRVLAGPLFAPEPVPHFARAVMDGYAVRAKDTFGASETMPGLLEVGGEVFMGEAVNLRLEPGRAIAVPTGGMLPAGADAVVMVEHTCLLDEKTIEVTKPVAPGDNILGEGEDIPAGKELYPAGWRLRPQDVGVLAALGLSRIDVHRVPVVAVFSTGDEIVPVSTTPLPPGRIRDINTFSLAAQIVETGGTVGARETIEDNLDSLVRACRDALVSHDVVLLSGGSSVGVRDFTLQILDAFEDAELLAHGVAIRPGKPTILARIGKKVFWGLPGQPMSALMVCKAFVAPSLAVLEGLKGSGFRELAGNTRNAILARQIPSVHGRTDCVPVVLCTSSDGRCLATPLFGKSATIGILGKADGYVMIPEHVEGLEQGTEILTYLFSHWYGTSTGEQAAESLPD